MKTLSFRENPLIRRPIIVAMVAVAVPVVIAIVIAEVIWETAKAMISITRRVIAEDTPKFKETIDYIREIW